MSRAKDMEFEEAVVAIGEAILDFGSDSVIQHRRFHYPGFGTQINFADATQIGLVLRWDGIAEDSPAPEGIEVPSSFRYEIRLITPIYGTDSHPDGYVLAQENIVRASATYFTALAQNRTLTGLVLDTGIEASFVGDLVDTQTQDEYYGHQINMRTQLWTS